ncbi:hypothetical protein [Micromonospora sp. WMMB482]|uniref:hypothetical protein n=1 Tax=Micromonospora sp. WMMB482 TaxID=2849653 RepID=UPI0035B45AD6
MSHGGHRWTSRWWTQGDVPGSNTRAVDRQRALLNPIPVPPAEPRRRHRPFTRRAP